MKKNYFIMAVLSVSLASCGGFESSRGQNNQGQKSSAVLSSVVRRSFIVKLDPGNGLGVPETITVTEGEQYGYLPSPSLDGYVFDGWFIGEEQIYEYSFVKSASTLVAHYSLRSKNSWTYSGFSIQHDVMNQSSSFTVPEIPVSEKLNISELKKEYSSWKVDLSFGERVLVSDLFGDVKYTIQLKNKSGKVLDTQTRKMKGTQTSNNRASCVFNTLNVSSITDSIYLTFSTENIFGVGIKDLMMTVSFVK